MLHGHPRPRHTYSAVVANSPCPPALILTNNSRSDMALDTSCTTLSPTLTTKRAFPQRLGTSDVHDFLLNAQTGAHPRMCQPGALTEPLWQTLRSLFPMYAACTPPPYSVQPPLPPQYGAVGRALPEHLLQGHHHHSTTSSLIGRTTPRCGVQKETRVVVEGATCGGHT